MKIKRGSSKAENNVAKKKKRPEEQELTLIESLEEELEDDGISLFTNKNVDDDYLVLPRDITEVESRDLGRYFNAFTQQKMWTRTLIGRVSANLREARSHLDEIKSQVFSSLPARLSVKEKELHFKANKEARVNLEVVALAEERLNLLTDYLHNLEDGIFNISREISRRGSDWNDDRRETNINNKRR